MNNLTYSFAGNPTAANPYVFIGATNIFGGGPPGNVGYWAAIRQRVLTPAEHALIGSSVNAIWQLFEGAAAA